MKIARHLFYFSIGALIGLHGSLNNWGMGDMIFTVVGIGFLAGVIEALCEI